MSIRISIIMACRLGDNTNSQLGRCLESLLTHADDAGCVEVLIKTDLDDPGLASLNTIIASYSNRIAITCITTARGGGYVDLHKAYLDLLRIASPSTQMYWVLSDDITINKKGWDTALLNAAATFEDGVFVLNTLRLSPLLRFSPKDSVECPDLYPVWSAKWIGMQGGFGYTFSTDGWTNLLCHRLKTAYGYDRRLLVDVQLERTLCEADNEGSERWNGVRKQTLDFMLSPQLQQLLDLTARNFVNAQPSDASPLQRMLVASGFQKLIYLAGRIIGALRKVAKMMIRLVIR